MHKLVQLVVAPIAALAILTLVLSSLLNAWSLNLANVEIARANALPPDSPDRVAVLASAEKQLAHAQSGGLTPRLALAQARLLLSRQEMPGAVIALEDLTLVPSLNDPIFAFVMGQANWSLGNRQAAMEYWRMAGAIEFFDRQAHRALDAHEWKKAAAAARISVALDPSSSDAHQVLGEALSRVDVASPESWAELDQAAQLARDPEQRAAIFSRQGEISLERGEYAAAIEFFNKASSIAPLDPRPRTGFALARLGSDPGAYDEVTSLLEETVHTSPWYTAAYLALADAATARGDTGAEKWLMDGLSRNPNNPLLLYALGKLYARQQHLAQAGEALTLALRYETHAESLLEISRTLEGLGQR